MFVKTVINPKGYIMNLLPYAVPFFLLLIFVEALWGRAKGINTYRINDSVNSLSLGLLSTVSKLVFLNVGFLVFSTIEQNWALFTLSTESTVDWIVGLVIYDFLYYWFHRVSHERQIFWGSHSVHHQSEDYNLSTALRQTSTGIVATWIFFVPCFFLGMPIYMYVGISTAHLIYQFWVHTQHIPKLGWFDRVFVSPSNHRVHHAQNPRYIDKNYGGLLILWDRLFGSFAEEDEKDEVIYGLRTPLNTWDPLWANVQIFVSMARDAWRTKEKKDKISMLWSRTGWRPKDVAERFPIQKTDLDNFHKYNPPLSNGAGFAVIAQYVLLTMLHLWAASQVMNLTYPVILVTALMQVYTVLALGAVLDLKHYAMRLEWSRGIVLATLLAGLYLAELINSAWFVYGIAYLLASSLVMLVTITLTNRQAVLRDSPASMP